MNFRNFFIGNRWWGKVLGCFFGYIMAGPFGAFLGIIIGNFFDKGLTSHFSRSYWSQVTDKPSQIQKIFFNSVFSVMGNVAKVNGRVSENHIQMALHLMDELSLNKEQKDLAKQYFNEGKKETFKLNETLYQLKKACHFNTELLKLFMEIQYKAAQVDGLSTKKIQLLDDIFKTLGYIPLQQQYRYYEDLLNRWSQTRGHTGANHNTGQSHYSGQNSNHQNNANRYSNDYKLRESYDLLEISPNANKPEVKRAYRRMISKNHPDKLIAKGLPEAMIKIANAKTQQITKAYETICDSRGW